MSDRGAEAAAFPEPESAPAFPADGGEMGALMRAKDWSKTPLGSTETWSPSLRMMVSFLLANRFPLLLWWGPEYISIYNDAYRPILGTKHPASLGQGVKECWSEIWPILKPLIDTPFDGGPATWMEDLFVEINRHGFVEETHFTIAYSPVPDETAPRGIGGVLATVHEITEKIIGERRVVALRDLGARAGEAKTAEEACAIAASTLAQHGKDVPFALLYLTDRDGERVRLAGWAGGDTGEPHVVELNETAERQSGWPLAEAMRRGEMITVEDLPARIAAVPRGPWSDPPRSAVVVPIRSTKAHELAGLLVAGVSSRLRLDEQYRSFFQLAATQIAAAIANARAYEEERKRAEALAEIDRAKTAFFSNVSHEFRTPLTLMLGPLEDVLAAPGETLPQRRDDLALVHRNGLRLLRLVNTLLDFSRIEAGRVQASYEPLDLATFTADLASVFRAATQKAGLALTVDCPPLAEPAWVDRDMWEKIVLNLVSNAFKFTLEGGIAIRLRQESGSAVLAVEDTGTGIPAHELPRLFDRFHRVERARGRTHEGTGIGLALVQELAKLHGGTVRVDSVVGKGSTFTVTVPLGTAHLPPERLRAERTLASTALGAQPYLEEALRWLPGGDAAGPAEMERELLPERSAAPEAEGERATVLLADDNADMRDYVRRLLAPRYEVWTVADGAAALSALRERRPDLLLSDVMMPGLDGFGLLRAVRTDPVLADLPVVLLSARAGEEASVEGLEAGADDYLVKPFSARELLARVSANLELAKLRRELDRRVAADLDAVARLRELGNLCGRSGTAFHDCLEETVDTAIAVTGADKGYIQLLDGSSGLLEIAAQRGFAEPFLNFFAKVPAGEAAACGAALQAAGRVIVEDMTRSDIFAGQASLGVLLEAGVRAVQSTPLISSAGKVLGMISTHFARPHRPGERELHLMDLLARQAADYLERNQGEAALHKVQDQLQAIFDSSPLGVYLVDADFRIRQVNPRGRPVFGDVPDLIGRDFDEVIRIRWPEVYADEIVARFRHTLATGEPYYVRERAEQRPDRGATEYYEWQINRVPLPDGHYGVVCYFRDVSAEVRAGQALAASEKRLRDLNDSLERKVMERTQALEAEIEERRKIEAALHQAQRLEAIGQLTGGVAHDFNNLLTVVIGQAETIIMAAEGNEPVVRMAAAAQRAAERGARLTSQLLAFSRRQRLRPESIDVNQVMNAIGELVRRAVGEAITLAIAPGPDLWPSVIDPAQLEAAILNLAVNARDAMPEGGRLVITTQNAVVGEAEARRLDLAPGDYVVVRVADTGCGMPPDVQRRCFEPFFTTKDVGKGTGLGLSQIYGFARQSGGTATVDSAVGRGTAIALYLPRAVQEPAAEAAAPSRVPSASGHGKTVLVVEDQDEVREVIETSLTELGYRILTARDGIAARELLETSEPIDLLLTDVIMPNGVNGVELAQWARRLRQDLKIVLISGYSRQARPAVGEDDFLFLQKPFRQAELSAAVAAALRG